MIDASARDRLDKWLWKARFFKTRALAAEAAGNGVRLNGHKTTKPGAQIKIGDFLTFRQGEKVRVIEVIALGERRGPAPEAQELYREHIDSRA